MAKIIGLPKLSPTMEEGTLAKWVKKEGDNVEIDDLLAEVETDKATMEFRSFDKGVLLKILVEEGTTLKPDQPVAVIGRAGETWEGKEEREKPGAGTGAGTKGAAKTDEVVEKAEEKREEKGEQKREERREQPRAEGRVLASPVVRKIAREKELDLRQVQGSGPGGRIIKRDVEGQVAIAPDAGRAVTATGLRTREPKIVKLSQMRKTIARRLTEAKQTIPHFYLTIDVDAEGIWRARQEINASLEKTGEKVSVNDILIKACALALRRVPEVNASFQGDVIHQHQRVDISVAVAVPDGLMTPVVRDADLKGILDIAHEVKDLAARAKDKKLKPEEMTDGTFSISNLGMFGIEDFAAVINPPEGAILAGGTVREEPVVRDGQIVPGRRMRMTLSCDHRVIDGATGARWLAALRPLIEQPLSMLL